MPSKTELIVALDVATSEQACALTKALGQSADWVKVGKQLFTCCGPEVVRRLREEYGKKIFLDLKFHDIPNTVGRAVEAAADLGADMVNVHASGGSAMLRAAAEAADGRLILVAVTVLTSLDTAAMREMGWHCRPAEQVLNLARLSAGAGLDGVVCSAWEIEMLRRELGSEFKLVVPGIRPAGTDCRDQKRVTTPLDAARAGATFIVVGRPITEAPDPAAAAAAIQDELA